MATPSEPLKYETWLLKVPIHCEGCKKKVLKVLKSIDGVYTTTIDCKQHKVEVTGNVTGDALIKRLLKSGKHAEMWPQPQPQSDNKTPKKGKGKGKEKKKPEQTAEPEPEPESGPEQNAAKQSDSEAPAPDAQPLSEEPGKAPENPTNADPEPAAAAPAAAAAGKKKKKGKNNGEGGESQAPPAASPMEAQTNAGPAPISMCPTHPPPPMYPYPPPPMYGVCYSVAQPGMPTSHYAPQMYMHPGYAPFPPPPDPVLPNHTYYHDTDNEGAFCAIM